MDRVDAMRLFVAVIDDGSLAAAARRLGRSPATVTRAVAMLEEIAGETLLQRTTRQLRLTPTGERHVEVFRDVLGRLEAVTGSAGGDEVRGRLTLTAPELFGQMKVVPVLEAFLHEHPHVAARVLLVNRLVDLVGEGVDLAVRLAPLPDSTLSAVKLGELRVMVCGAPDYIERSGAPERPEALCEHECIGLNPDGDGELWPFRVSSGKSTRIRSVHVPTRLSLNHAGAGIGAALRGHGLVRVRAYQVADHVAAGRLVPVLVEFEPAPAPVHLVFHSDRGRSAPVRSLIDRLVPALRKELRTVEALVAPAAD